MNANPQNFKIWNYRHSISGRMQFDQPSLLMFLMNN